MDLNIPTELRPGEPLVIEGCVWNDTITALSIETNGFGVFDVMNCTGAINLTYDAGLSNGAYDIRIIAFTGDPNCILSIEQTIHIQDPIAFLNVSSLPEFAVSKEMQVPFMAWVLEGTGIVVSCDWGDGIISTVNCYDSSDISIVVFSHTYQIAGVFTVSLLADNGVSSFSVNQTITVYERIHNLSIDGDSTVFFPPGTGMWEISVGANQDQVENMVWNIENIRRIE